MNRPPRCWHSSAYSRCWASSAAVCSGVRGAHPDKPAATTSSATATPHAVPVTPSPYACLA